MAFTEMDPAAPISKPLGRQATKSRRTRTQVVESTVRLIRERGFLSATPLRIAEQAGLSWGAVQHHFVSKEQLLRSIVAAAMEAYLVALAELDFAGLTLEQRVERLVECSWAHQCSDIYQASIEIALVTRGSAASIGHELLSDNRAAMERLESAAVRLFAGCATNPDGQIKAISYMHCVMTGLICQRLISGDQHFGEDHLVLCKRAMLDILGAGPPA